MMGYKQEQMELLLFNPEELILQNHLLKKVDRMVSFNFIYDLLAPTYSNKGYCWREANGVPHGAQYEKCRGVYSEQNAINVASAHDLLGATLYLYGGENGKTIEANPCDLCARSIKNVRIKEVICSKLSAD